MNLDPKFLKYEKNNAPEMERKFEGIATISLCGGQIIQCYKVQKGKDGKGIYIAPFSASMNDQWHKACIIDSNYANEEISNMIRRSVMNIGKPQITHSEPSYAAIDDSSCPF